MITHLVELSGPEAIRRTGLAQKQLGIAWNWFLATNICHDVFMSKLLDQSQTKYNRSKSTNPLTNRSTI